MFQNEVLRALDKQRLKLNQYPCADFYNRTYNNTLDREPLRHYLIALAGSSVGDPSEFWLANVHRDALVDMTKYMRVREKEGRKGWVKFSEEELKQFYVEETKAGLPYYLYNIY